MKSNFVFTGLFAFSLLFGCSLPESKRVDSNKFRQQNHQLGKETILTVKIKHFEASEVVLVSGNYTDTATLNLLGEFKFVFNLPGEGYFVLKNGTRSVRLFLNPGDNLGLESDQNDIFNSIEFTGKGAQANNYLKEKYHRMLSHQLTVSDLYQVPEKQFRYSTDSVYVIDKIFLEEYAKTHQELTPFFIGQEQASILYDWANKLMEYPSLNTTATLGDKKKYFSFLNKVDVNNPALLELYEYKQFLNSYIAWYTDEQIKGNPDKNLNTVDVNIIRMQQTAVLIANEKVKNYLLGTIVKEQVKYFGYKNTEPIFEFFELNCTDAQLKDELLTPFQNYRNLTAGSKAPPVTFTDIAGQSYTLGSFKGSYVYIDVWATWCLPCKREFPYFEELGRRFSNKNILFVSFSVDADKNKWKEYLSTFGKTNNQFLITNPDEFLNLYLIKTIPRFIILNPEGKIEDCDAFRPSEPDLKWFASLPDKKAI